MQTNKQSINLLYPVSEPASKRIDWTKGPYYNNVKPSLRPPYYPQKSEATMKPFQRNYDYERHPSTYNIPNSNPRYNEFPGYDPAPVQHDVNQPWDSQKPRYEERPLPQTSGVSGPQNFVQDDNEGKQLRYFILSCAE